MQQLHNATITDNLPDGCALAILRTVPAIMRFIRHQMRQHRQAELTVPQFRVLVFLSHHQEASVSAVADHLGLSRAAASRMVDSLVRRGLMKRQNRLDDRRHVALSLTQRGKKTYQTACDANLAALAGNLSMLSKQELIKIHSVLQALSQAFEI